ncbi:MAG: hypothetical protein JNL74_19065 [Fibrobacteres bacterium]|nr:hypothetical protein [Fibrobacterota bacterium]
MTLQFRKAAILVSVLSSLFLVACSAPLRAVITDFQGQRREVVGITTDRGGVIEVLDGPAYRKIPINKIQNLLVKNNGTASRDGELYYSAEVWLTDSTKVLSYLMPNGQRTEAYINVTSNIIGKTDAGTFAIPMKDVRQVRISKGKK